MVEHAYKAKAVYEPDMVCAINAAYAGALVVLKGAAAHSDRRVALARHIIELARNGESDERRLRDGALAKMQDEA